MSETWRNIEVSIDDPEIKEIDQFEKQLGKLSENVVKIRALITRFEVCHFKYLLHLNYIKDSIKVLNPAMEPDIIGSNHIKEGKDAWRRDSTGRSAIGQQYLNAIRQWLEETKPTDDPNERDEKLEKQISRWLGTKNRDRERLVKLLVARLTWDWKSLEELQEHKKFKEVEYQILRTDICHYHFPQNLDLLIRGIGNLAPATGFAGCGSFDPERKEIIEEEFANLKDQIKLLINNPAKDLKSLIKTWLLACLAKTIKEQVNLTKPMVRLTNSLS